MAVVLSRGWLKGENRKIKTGQRRGANNLIFLPEMLLPRNSLFQLAWLLHATAKKSRAKR
jgi:hypothetical protein